MKDNKWFLTVPALLMLALFAGCHPGSASTGSSRLKLQLITDKIHDPVAMAIPGDGSGRIFICQKEGEIWIIDHGKKLRHPFLDVSGKMIPINQGYDERGLLGLAFSPTFAADKKFYVYYSAPADSPHIRYKNVLASFSVSKTDADKADKNSEHILMHFQKQETNHNGGDLQFGPDGYLYLGLGDGGGGGDKHGPIGDGQYLDTLLGKIVRIDVSKPPYVVPADNPFVGKPAVRPEIWAYGLRNPWRFSFDKKTGALFCGDVGQGKYEEVDIIHKGGNYGWRVMEGYHIYNMPPGGADTADMIKPITEYDHKTTGIAVVGGYVYRGTAIPSMEGKYIFGDYNGRMFYLTHDADGKWIREDLKFKNEPDHFQIYCFGQDRQGELYVLGAVAIGNGFNGMVYKIVPG
jgi:glucose/arabinose dehydrogenase